MTLESLSYDICLTVLAALVAMAIVDENFAKYVYLQYKTAEIEVRKKILMWKIERQFKNMDSEMRRMADKIRKEREEAETADDRDSDTDLP